MVKFLMKLRSGALALTGPKVGPEAARYFWYAEFMQVLFAAGMCVWVMPVLVLVALGMDSVARLYASIAWVPVALVILVRLWFRHCYFREAGKALGRYADCFDYKFSRLDDEHHEAWCALHGIEPLYKRHTDSDDAS